MFFHRLAGEMRTGWRETALIAHKGRQNQLVKADQTDQQMLQGVHQILSVQNSTRIAGRNAFRLFQIIGRIKV